MTMKLLTDPRACGPDRQEAETLLAAVLTLMTDHALACCEGHRATVAQRIAACFLALTLCPGLAAGSRALALQLHVRWIGADPQAGNSVWPAVAKTLHADTQTLRGDPRQQYDSRVLWHTTPELIQ